MYMHARAHTHTHTHTQVTAKNLELLQTRVANLEEEKAFRISEQVLAYDMAY